MTKHKKNHDRRRDGPDTGAARFRAHRTARAGLRPGPRRHPAPGGGVGLAAQGHHRGQAQVRGASGQARYQPLPGRLDPFRGPAPGRGVPYSVFAQREKRRARGRRAVLRAHHPGPPWKPSWTTDGPSAWNCSCSSTGAAIANWPIQADYVGQKVHTAQGEHVDVGVAELDGEDTVSLVR